MCERHTCEAAVSKPSMPVEERGRGGPHRTCLPSSTTISAGSFVS